MNSLWRPDTPGIPSHFKRRTHEQVAATLEVAAAETNVKKREAILTDIGRNASGYDFDDDGGYMPNFALAENRSR